MKDIKVVSSLEKVFLDAAAAQFPRLERFSMLKNEKKSFQVVLEAEKARHMTVHLDSTIGEFLNVSVVENVPSDFPVMKNADDFYIKKEAGLYPDLLRPVADGYTFEAAGTYAFWIEIAPKKDGDLPAGEHTITVTLQDGAAESSAQVTVEVIDALLPKQTLIYTNWLHTDCLMSYYGFEAFSDAYWEALRNYLTKASDYGMNCVLTPVFTPPLDTEIGKERPTVQLVKVKKQQDGTYAFDFALLKKWIDIAKACNMEYFELSHLFTQWGAKHAPKIMAEVDGGEVQIFGWKTKASSPAYAQFLTAFGAALKTFLKAEQLEKNVLIHISDEPPFNFLLSYKKASKITHRIFGEYKIMDAMSSYPLAKICQIRYPIPANDFVDRFIGRFDDLWTYYCSAQSRKNVSNRFFATSSLRNRILGYQMYKYDIHGFLHWGYNFYYTRLSKKAIDPYKVTDAGKAFASGDSFIVYPGDGLKALNSLRLNVFYDGLQDMQALQLLESKIGKTAVLQLIESSLDTPLTFSAYPHSEAWLLENREAINAEIKKNL